MVRLIRTLTLSCLPLVCFLASRADELPSTPMLRLDPGRHTAVIRGIDTDRAGRWLVSASDDKTVRVWDAGSGRMLRVLRPPIGEKEEDDGKLYAVAISPDGGLVACGGLTRLGNNQGYTVYLFMRASGRLVSRTAGWPGAIEHLAFSPDGSMLAATLAGRNGMRLLAVNSREKALGAPGTTVLQLIAEDPDYGDRAQGAHFSHDSRWLVTSSYDGSIRLYDLSTIERAAVSVKTLRPAVSQKAPGGSHPNSVKFSPDSSKVSVLYGDTIGVSVLSARDLHLFYSPNTTGQTDGNGVLLTTAWSKDGRFLFGAGHYKEKLKAGGFGEHLVRRWPAEGEGTPTDFRSGATDSIFGLAELPDGSFGAGQRIDQGPADAGHHQTEHGVRLPAGGETVGMSVLGQDEPYDDFESPTLLDV